MQKWMGAWCCLVAISCIAACGHKSMVSQLPDIVAAAQQHAPTRISVVGHTDTMDDKAYNLDLSIRRAMAVKRLLVDNGVDDTFIDVSSHGEKNPMNSLSWLPRASQGILTSADTSNTNWNNPRSWKPWEALLRGLPMISTTSSAAWSVTRNCCYWICRPTAR